EARLLLTSRPAHIPHRNQRRLPARKRMTIAAGFLCPDGLVVGSDTLLSSDVKQYGHKVWHHPQTTEDWYFGVAGAGDYTHIQAIKDALFTSIVPDSSLDRMHQIAQLAVATYFSTHAFKSPSYQRGEFGVLVLMRHKGVLRLLENSESVCAPVEGYACIGS